MHKNIHPGAFIVLEGPDGSGQSTQVAFLARSLEGRGQRTVLTKEPTIESEAGEEIRKALAGETRLSAQRLQELFARDRGVHIERVIIPALRDGKVVISDRYIFSSFAFGVPECDLEWLIELNKDFLLPDVTFVLVVRPEVCLARIEKRGTHKTLFEHEEKLHVVLENYHILATRFPNVHLIDGERPPEVVHEEILRKAEEVLRWKLSRDISPCANPHPFAKPKRRDDVEGSSTSSGIDSEHDL